MNNQDLAKKWIELKRKEDELKKARVELETAIVENTKLEKDNGANNFENMLTITTGYSRSWDQEGLAKLNEQGISPFPFKTEYKEDRTLSKGLEKMAKDFWDTYYEPLLTVKPKKPSLKIR